MRWIIIIAMELVIAISSASCMKISIHRTNAASLNLPWVLLLGKGFPYLQVSLLWGWLGGKGFPLS